MLHLQSFQLYDMVRRIWVITFAIWSSNDGDGHLRQMQDVKFD
jgi:hypothetical protein